jgi:cytochrome c-type biogenesis protein CcmH/NrfF
MTFTVGNLLFWSAAAFALVMLRELWLSEKARRRVERARANHFASEREFARARQRERGDI